MLLQTRLVSAKNRRLGAGEVVDFGHRSPLGSALNLGPARVDARARPGEHGAVDMAADS